MDQSMKKNHTIKGEIDKNIMQRYLTGFAIT
jgi:hypothetical protein